MHAFMPCMHCWWAAWDDMPCMPSCHACTVGGVAWDDMPCMPSCHACTVGVAWDDMPCMPSCHACTVGGVAWDDVQCTVITSLICHALLWLHAGDNVRCLVLVCVNHVANQAAALFHSIYGTEGFQGNTMFIYHACCAYHMRLW